MQFFSVGLCRCRPIAPQLTPRAAPQALSSYISRSTLVLLLAQVMGMYFLSSVLLMRMNLPIGYRCETPCQALCRESAENIAAGDLQADHH